MSDRDYQIEIDRQIRVHFANGIKKVLVHLATGGGKTHVFCKFLEGAFKKGKHSIMLVRGRKLVDQASARLFHQAVPHGVRMANHWNKNYGALTQICSVDTLISRMEIEGLPKATLIIVDEAHLATSEGFMELLAMYPDAYIIAVTATPYTSKSLRHVADVIVHPITMRGLIEAGYLTSFKYYAPFSPDLSDVKIDYKTGDYKSDGLEKVMNTSKLTGNVVDHWVKFGQNRPSIFFGVNIRHSKDMVDRFVNAGIRAEHCDADSTDQHRNDVIKRLISGETQVVCNVGIFCTGVDIVPLSCMIQGRPTKSLSLFYQQCGRLTRPMYAQGFPTDTIEGRLAAIRASVKPNSLILDHAGNLIEHGFPTDEPEANLDGRPVSSGSKGSTFSCPQCFCVFLAKLRVCPECHYDRDQNFCTKCEKQYPSDMDACPDCGQLAKKKRMRGMIEEESGELNEISSESIPHELARLQAIRQKKGYRTDWPFRKLIEKFGEEKAAPYLPAWFKAGGKTDPFGNSPFQPMGGM